VNTEPPRTSAPTGPFSATLWAAAQPVHRAIPDLPFNRELTAGTLDPATFALFWDSAYRLETWPP